MNSHLHFQEKPLDFQHLFDYIEPTLYRGLSSKNILYIVY